MPSSWSSQYLPVNGALGAGLAQHLVLLGGELARATPRRSSRSSCPYLQGMRGPAGVTPPAGPRAASPSERGERPARRARGAARRAVVVVRDDRGVGESRPGEGTGVVEGREHQGLLESGEDRDGSCGAGAHLVGSSPAAAPQAAGPRGARLGAAALGVGAHLGVARGVDGGGEVGVHSSLLVERVEHAPTKLRLRQAPPHREAWPTFAPRPLTRVRARLSRRCGAGTGRRRARPRPPGCRRTRRARATGCEPTGVPSSSPRSVSMTGVTGWCSAKPCSHAGIVSTGTNALLGVGQEHDEERDAVGRLRRRARAARSPRPARRSRA